MKLNKSKLEVIKGSVELPNNYSFSLPEKVLQFGTGVLLRGLPDFFIDKANKQGVFNGRVVVVKSTDKGDTKDFDEQNSLYTVCVRGIEKGNKVHENIVCSSISRVLTASKEWNNILDFAASPSLEIVISNTTEAGIAYLDEDIFNKTPKSFPAKLLAILYHRYKMYNGSKDRGLVIIPTELIPDNGDILKSIILKLAKKNDLNQDFINWVEENNSFCNSLVDRIVPGKPDEETLNALRQELGYDDELLTVAEAYSLWVIQGDEAIKSKLAFAEVDKAIVITPDIDLHRELKLRLLNGTHTLSCAVAFLSDLKTVKEAMDDESTEAFISILMKSEIAHSIPYPVAKEIAEDFSDKVLDRFRNPHIKHQWISISMNYTSKLKLRVVPLVIKYAELFGKVPELMAFGFAAYIRFMKAVKIDGNYYGEFNGSQYLINDEKAEHIFDLFTKANENVIKDILSDVSIWDTDLSLIPGFEETVKTFYQEIEKTSVKEVLKVTVGDKINA